jgi:hypothetical protein
MWERNIIRVGGGGDKKLLVYNECESFFSSSFDLMQEEKLVKNVSAICVFAGKKF